MQEDLLLIKGELRKLNHKLMKDDLRRNSLLLSTVEKQSLDEHESIGIDDCATDSHADSSLSKNVTQSVPMDVPDIERDIGESLSPSAPELSQEQQILDRLLFDEGGEPSAPSFADICKGQHRESGVSDGRSSDVVLKEKHSYTNTTTNNSAGSSHVKDNRVDKDGFILVNRKKQKKNVVGSRESSSSLLRSASRTADLYVGNCDVDVTTESLTQYICDVMKVKIHKCEQLETKYSNYTSFKVTLFVNDRMDLLSEDVWPSGIVCRKYYKPRNSTQS